MLIRQNLNIYLLNLLPNTYKRNKNILLIKDNKTRKYNNQQASQIIKSKSSSKNHLPKILHTRPPNPKYLQSSQILLKISFNQSKSNSSIISIFQLKNTKLQSLRTQNKPQKLFNN